MKRYRFRLDPVLRVRRNEEDLARAAVLAAQAVVAAELEQLSRRDAAYAQAHKPSGPVPAADFLYVQAHRKALAAAVLDQRKRVQQAEHGAEGARQAWTAAAARVGALERLDERSRAEHDVRTLREEELTVDDLVVARFGRADR